MTICLFRFICLPLCSLSTNLVKQQILLNNLNKTTVPVLCLVRGVRRKAENWTRANVFRLSVVPFFG